MLFSCVQAFAQYSLSGKVIDAGSSEELIGATVVVKQYQIGKITDFDGRFVIGGIPENTVTLEISYVGYITKTLNLELETRSTKLLIKLEEDATALDEVVVTGVMEGQIAAMSTMKRAANIKNVVSQEQIVTFPDLNAAEVMQRIPGITLKRDQGDGRYVQLRGTPAAFTNFNINGEQVPSPEGDVRNVGLDIIPSDQIEFIEVTKVLTPDMDGDGIGGSVNVITRSPKEGEPQLGAVLSGGYNHLRQTPNYNLQFTYGQRFKNIGFQVNASYFQNNQGSDNIEYDFDKGPFFNSQAQALGENNYFLHFRDVQLRHYDIQRTRFAISPTLDYEFNEDSRIYLKAMVNSFTDVETRRRKTFTTDDPFNYTRYIFGGIEHDLRFRTQNQQLSTLAIGGEHLIGRVKIDYQLFGSSAGETTPDFLEITFDDGFQAIDMSFDFSDPEYPKASFDSLPSIAATDFVNFDYDGMVRESSRTSETLLTPRLNIEIPYTINSGNDGFIKFGGKIRSRVKSRDVINETYGNYRPINNRTIAGIGDPLILTELSDGWRDDNFLNQGYVLEAMPDIERVLDHIEFNYMYYVPSRNESRFDSYVSDYEYRENIYAAYGMVRHQYNKLMILAGVRYELTDITQNQGFGVFFERIVDSLNNVRVVTTVTPDDQPARHPFWLPQIQLKYELNQNVNLRAAVTRTYNRPNYDEIVNSTSRDADNRGQLFIGNPNILFPTATNYDLMIERYKNTSIFSAGIFYKEIQNPIYPYRALLRDQAERDAGELNVGNTEVTFPTNGLSASVFGVELQAQFKFDFLPGALSNFGIYSNYTYTNSTSFIASNDEANLGNEVFVYFNAQSIQNHINTLGVEEFTLPGQAANTANIALLYDGPKFFARLSANYQDDFLLSVGLDRDFDEYYDEAFRLDYTMNYRMNDVVTLFSDVINIIDTPLRLYLGQEDIVKQQEFYSWWFRVGARINI